MVDMGTIVDFQLINSMANMVNIMSKQLSSNHNYRHRNYIESLSWKSTS